MSYVDVILQTGDRVIHNMDKEARSWGRKGPADGTLGTVLGFTKCKTHKARWGLDRYFYSPGVYYQDGVPLILWDDGSSEVSGWDHDLADTVELERRFAAWRKQNHNHGANHRLLRIEDLPETQFFELDIVQLKPGTQAASSFQDSPKRLRVSSILWHIKPDERGQAYDVEWIDDDGNYARCGSTWLHDNELELLERGNVWREYVNEPLKFADIREELAFAHGTGKVHEQRNPANQLYSWSADEVLAAIRAGTVDSMNLTPGLFGGKTRPTAYRCEDRDLGERVRAYTIEGFAGVTHLPEPT